MLVDQPQALARPQLAHARGDGRIECRRRGAIDQAQHRIGRLVVQRFVLRQRDLHAPGRIAARERGHDARDLLARGRRIEATAGIAIGQRPLQRAQGAGDRGAIGRCGVEVDADHRIADRDRGPVARRIRAVAQPGLSEMVAPVLIEKPGDRLGQRLRTHALGHESGHAAACLLQAFAAMDRFGGAALGDLRATALLVQPFAQFLGREREHRLVGFVFLDDPVDEPPGMFEQVAVDRGVAGIAVAGLGDRIQQPARGMAALAEQ
ncbi:hypothetical protein ABE532_09755 [Luteimonas sp. TWI165]|uniref:hypothetical protein n=1 Tax=Luteimonas sp. TWI165 TaxID=3136772 RepID=UPI00320849F8